MPAATDFDGYSITAPASNDPLQLLLIYTVHKTAGRPNHVYDYRAACRTRLRY